jgi:hypothetical protein
MISSRSRSLVLAAGVLLLPALASAQGRRYGRPYDGPGDQGLILGARIGYAFPGGDLVAPGFQPFSNIPAPLSSLGDSIDSKIPIWLEVGYRFTPIVWGTIYLDLSPLGVKSAACEQGAECDGSDVRFGLDVQFHFLPYQQMDPWFGIGIGAEFLKMTSLVDGEERFSGWEFPLLEGGLDFNVSPRFALGPYAALSFARFNSYRATLSGQSSTVDVGGAERTHEWFQVGLKATIKL